MTTTTDPDRMTSAELKEVTLFLRAVRVAEEPAVAEWAAAQLEAFDAHELPARYDLDATAMRALSRYVQGVRDDDEGRTAGVRAWAGRRVAELVQQRHGERCAARRARRTLSAHATASGTG